MTPAPAERLREYAQQIYGEGWQSRMARHLGLWPQTIGRWARGITPPNPLALELLIAYIALGWKYDAKTNEVRNLDA